jgi:hypothetical protein
MLVILNYLWEGDVREGVSTLTITIGHEKIDFFVTGSSQTYHDAYFEFGSTIISPLQSSYHSKSLI